MNLLLSIPPHGLCRWHFLAVSSGIFGEVRCHKGMHSNSKSKDQIIKGSHLLSFFFFHNCKYRVCYLGLGLEFGLIYTSVCMCLVKGSGPLILGRHSLIPAHLPTTFTTDCEVLGQEIKRGTWTILISNLIWLFSACGCTTPFVLSYVWADQRSDRSLTVIHRAQDFRMQHQTWRLLGEKVGLCSSWESSCNFHFPILGHQPKMRRELLQAKAAGPRVCWIKKDWRRD